MMSLLTTTLTIVAINAYAFLDLLNQTASSLYEVYFVGVVDVPFVFGSPSQILSHKSLNISMS